MAMKQCPICGEKYSDTYKKCPFCEEEKAIQEGKRLRRNTRGGKRTAQKSPNLLTPMLVILILIMAALLVYLLFGERFAKLPSIEKQPQTPVEDEQPEQPEIPDEQEPVQGEEPDVTMPENPGTTETPGTTTTPQTPPVTANAEYEAAAKLPKGLRLSTEDFTLKKIGETATIQVSGGGGSYRWYSKDIGIASVDQNGTVTAVAKGNTTVLVTDGSKMAECIVRVSGIGTVTPSTGTTTPTESTGSGLKAGAAKVVNAGSGVRIRSGPSTDHEILATVKDGADVQVVKSAGGGWYEITFSNVGGVKTTGYMMSDFLQNK
ncbi:MAG: SH3 domain-containing protein [Oscillibacter sp.]|nr:SH3 domain-containing protein [Oscillibacter sp.]